MAQADAGEYWIINTKAGDPFSNNSGWQRWDINNNNIYPTLENFYVETSSSKGTFTLIWLANHRFELTPSTTGIYYGAGSPSDSWAQVTFNISVVCNNLNWTGSIYATTYCENSSGHIQDLSVTAINNKTYRTSASSSFIGNSIYNWRQSYFMLNTNKTLTQSHRYRFLLLLENNPPGGTTFNVNGTVYCGFGLGYPVPTETKITAANANIYNFMLRQSDTATAGNKIIKAPYINSSFSLNDNTNIKAADRDRLINYLKDGTTRFL